MFVIVCCLYIFGSLLEVIVRYEEYIFMKFFFCVGVVVLVFVIIVIFMFVKNLMVGGVVMYLIKNIV